MSRSQQIFDRIVESGYSEIQKFVEERDFENLYLDFKRSSDNGQSNKLSQNDRNNLAKAISGFGNSEGGVIVWGVDCSNDIDGADVAHEETFIFNPIRFASLLEGAVSGCTVPVHTGIVNHAVQTDNQNGFVVTLIPKSNNAPHQALYNNQFYIRAGSGFSPTPFGVLAGMFGRRPQPDMFHKWTVGVPSILNDCVRINFGLMVFNYGLGIARDIYFTIAGYGLPGRDCRLEFEPTDRNRVNWKDRFGLGIHFSAVSTWDYRLPPDCFDQPVVLQLYLTPPFDGLLNIVGTIGSGTSSKREFGIEQDASTIEEFYDRLILRHNTTAMSEDEMTKFAVELLGIGNQSELNENR